MIQNGEEFEILVNYGEILDNKEFKDLKDKMVKLKTDFEKQARKLIGDEE